MNFREILLNWILNWIIFWQNSNIELNQFGYRSPLWPKAKSFRISVNLENVAFKFKKKMTKFLKNHFWTFTFIWPQPPSLQSHHMKACSYLEMFFCIYNCLLLVAFLCNVSHLPKAGQHLSKRCHNLLLWCPEIQKHYSTASANHSTTGISSCGMICRCSSTNSSILQIPINEHFSEFVI